MRTIRLLLFTLLLFAGFTDSFAQDTQPANPRSKIVQKVTNADVIVSDFNLATHTAIIGEQSSGVAMNIAFAPQFKSERFVLFGRISEKELRRYKSQTTDYRSVTCNKLHFYPRKV